MKRFLILVPAMVLMTAVVRSAQADIDTWVLSGSTKIDSGTPCPDGVGYNSGDSIDFVDNGGGSLNNNPGYVGAGYGGGNLAQAYLYQWNLTNCNFALCDLTNSYIAGANLSVNTRRAGQYSITPTLRVPTSAIARSAGMMMTITGIWVQAIVIAPSRTQTLRARMPWRRTLPAPISQGRTLRAQAWAHWSFLSPS